MYLQQEATLIPGTLDQPFTTIQKAANVAKEESTIYIRGGIYNQKVRVTHSGASEIPITFQNYQVEKVILHGSKVKLHDNNNIGIVLIGHEGVSPVASLDQARNGIVRNNIVHHNSSINNTSYNEYSADGIYVDRGKEIIIEQNQSYENDLGIEVASEHAGKSASQITVRDNTISNNIMSGIAIGGYDSKQGYAENNTITNNVIYKNDTKDQESGQIELNYDTRNNVITNNQIYASNSRIFISNNFSKNTGNKLDYNQYYGEFDQTNG